MTSERRHSERYDRLALRLSITRPGIAGMLRLDSAVECLNFSRSGLRFESEKPFQVDERVVLDLRIFGIDIKELCGMISNVQQHEDRYTCGVRFCFEDKHMQKNEVMRTLLQIESNLKSYEDYPDAL